MNESDWSSTGTSVNNVVKLSGFHSDKLISNNDEKGQTTAKQVQRSIRMKKARFHVKMSSLHNTEG